MDDLLTQIRTVPLYPYHKCVFFYDQYGFVKRDEDGKPKKSIQNDLIETNDYICIDRCLYVDKSTNLFGQIRIVRNLDSGWNPYGDDDDWIKMCTKSHVIDMFPSQRSIAKRTMQSQSVLYLQVDTFNGIDKNGKYEQPSVEIFQVRIINVENYWMQISYL